MAQLRARCSIRHARFGSFILGKSNCNEVHDSIQNLTKAGNVVRARMLKSGSVVANFQQLMSASSWYDGIKHSKLVS